MCHNSLSQKIHPIRNPRELQSKSKWLRKYWKLIVNTNTEHRSGTGESQVKARPVTGCPCFSPQGNLNKALCSHSTVLKFHRIEKTICRIKSIELPKFFKFENITNLVDKAMASKLHYLKCSSITLNHLRKSKNAVHKACKFHDWENCEIQEARSLTGMATTASAAVESDVKPHNTEQFVPREVGGQS